MGTAQVGTAASDDYAAASEDYAPKVGTAQVGTAASDDYAAASEDYAPQVGTAAILVDQAYIDANPGTPYEIDDTVPASDDYAAASEDYAPQVGTAQVGTAASDDYVAASEDYVPQVGKPAVLADADYVAAHPAVQVGDELTPGIASASSPFSNDILIGFSVSADKLDLPSTTLLNFADGVGDLFVSTVDKGMVKFGGAVQGASYLEKAEVLLTSMGEGKLSAAFVMDGDTYVVQGDGVAGIQETDILIKLVGVTNVTDLGSIIV